MKQLHAISVLRMLIVNPCLGDTPNTRRTGSSIKDQRSHYQHQSDYSKTLVYNLLFSEIAVYG